jgi:tetratricopeptide (TPR) repeat protein
LLDSNFIPDESLRYFQEGLVKIQKKDVIGALRAFDSALALDPEFAQAHRERSRDFDLISVTAKAIEALSQAIDLWPKTLVFGLLQDRGQALVKLGDLDKAIEDFSLAIELYPGSTWSYFWRGKTYGNKQKWDLAIADLSMAIKLAPNQFPSAHVERGSAFREKGEFSQAIEDFSKSIDIMPSYADAYFQRARTFVEMESYEKASMDFEKTKEVDPSTAKLVDPWIRKVEESLLE